jgi:2-oxoglutarate ferredoxin oxidoreductase subunit delta
MPVIMIEQQLCKKCSICAEFCPEGIPDPFIESYNSTRCKLCRLCELYCPDFAVSVYRDVVETEEITRVER